MDGRMGGESGVEYVRFKVEAFLNIYDAFFWIATPCTLRRWQ